MRYEHNFYRTTKGFLDLEFLFVDLGELGWRAYILSKIDYKRVSATRGTAFTDIHILTEQDEVVAQKIRNFIQATKGSVEGFETINYVCWNTVVKDLDKFRNITCAWSEITAYYIQHGGTFPSIQKKLLQKLKRMVKL